MSIYNYKRSKKITLVILFSISVMLSSCMSIRPSATRSGNSSFETFYIGDGATQYYIKPVVFKSQKFDLKIDFTFRCADDLNANATVNFSMVGDSIVKSIDSLIFKCPSADFKTHEIKLIFNEKKKEKFTSRFTCSIPLSVLNSYTLDSSNSNIEMCLKKEKEIFVPSKKTKRIFENLGGSLFVLFKQ
jgi:hypothetical protein